MKLLKIIVKVVLSILAVIFLGGSGFSGDPLGAAAFFAACYGLVTWYMFSFSSGMLEGAGDGGLFELLFVLVLNLALPALVLAAPILLMQSFLPDTIGKIGQVIYGAILVIACLWCMFGDFIHIVRLFKPDFLGSFGDIFDLSLDD